MVLNYSMEKEKKNAKRGPKERQSQSINDNKNIQALITIFQVE